MDFRKRFALCVITVMALITLTGCTLPLRLGYSGNSIGNKASASFVILWETKQVSLVLKEGKVITFDYELKQEKGELNSVFRNSKGEPLLEFAGNTSGKKTLSVLDGGVYTLAIQAKGAKGSYNFAWNVE